MVRNRGVCRQGVACFYGRRSHRPGPCLAGVALAVVIAACGGEAGQVEDGRPDAAPVDVWSDVRDVVEANELADVTVLVGDATGTLFVHEKGASTADTEYRIASATKWVTAAVIMRLVRSGTLDLDDHPQDYLDYWTGDPADPRSRATLEQLLSFTSGFRGRPRAIPCAGDPETTLDACARTMYDEWFFYEPGTTYFYGPAHMHTAARMAEVATGKPWTQIVVDEVAEPLGVADTVSWALASEQHPMPSGGLRTSGASYAAFLQAIASGELLGDSVDVMAEPRTDGLTIGYSPMTSAWTYALGQWRECGETEWTEACDEQGIASSPGAFGFYPWYDARRGYWAIVATELSAADGERPLSVTMPLGYAIRPLIEQAYADVQATQAAQR